MPIISFPKDPNVISAFENKRLSPLHFAAWFNACESVECLIQREDCNVEIPSAFGQKPLHYAVARASLDLVKVSNAIIQLCWVSSNQLEPVLPHIPGSLKNK